jgi:DNA-binding NtrC family response regulator
MPITIKHGPAEEVDFVAEEPRPQPELVETAASVDHASDSDEEPILSLRSLRAQVEIKAIQSALNRTGWNRKQAARLLKISYRGLLYKIHRHNIAPTAEHS